jgi:transcriptional regulator with XRE-family HTH domain
MGNGLNQAQVAKKLGVSPQTISRILRDYLQAIRPVWPDLG